MLLSFRNFHLCALRSFVSAFSESAGGTEQSHAYCSRNRTLVNIAGMMILRKSSGDSLNMKGAYFEVLSDMLTSVGVMIAGVVMLTTGWYYADPLISAGIGLLIFPRTWRLLMEAIHILLEWYSQRCRY